MYEYVVEAVFPSIELRMSWYLLDESLGGEVACTYR